MIQETTSHKLEAPGAGLPWIELQFARVLFATGLLTTTRKKNDALVLSEKEKILALISAYSPEQLSTQVLVERLKGMEDSSRYWSVYMTLSHIAIVNNVVNHTIELLLQGKSPEVVASTANVKPSPGVGSEAIQEFVNSAERFLNLPQESLKTTSHYRHPWFGPLDARGWHFLAGFHMRLHRGQIVAILKSLP